MVRPVIHSTKHYEQISIATVAAATKLDTPLISAVAVVNKNAPNEVEEGSIIKAIYIEYWVRSAEVSAGSGINCMYKNPGGSVPFTTTELAQINDAENKKNVFWFQQGLFNDVDADAIAIMKGWYKIPKSKQRFGLGDRLFLSTSANGAIDLHVCGFATFKEYN